MQIDPPLISAFTLIGALTVGALLGILLVALLLYRQRRTHRNVPEGPGSRGAGSTRSGIAEFLAWPQAKAAWGSAGVMLFCLVAGLIAVAIRASADGFSLFSTLNLDPQQVKLAVRVITGSAVVSAALPLYLPRIASAGRGAALGLMTGLIAGIATSLFATEGEHAFSIILTSTLAIGLVCTVSALAAYVAGVGLSFLARRLVSGSRALWRSVVAATVGLLVFGAYIFWPQFVHWYKTDPDYRLAPSTWKGEMKFDRSYPFTLVIEQVQPDGQFTGFMDRENDFRLKIEGKATANHLVFMDTQVLRGSGLIGIKDRKDVWIRGSSMAGTDKGGLGRLSAQLVAPSARPQPAQVTAIPVTAAPAGSVVAIGQTPAASTGGEPPRPPEEFPIAMDHDGEALWLSRNTNRANLTLLLRWKPTTGGVEEYHFSEPTLSFAPDSEHSVAATSFGLLILGGRFVVAGQWQRDPTRVVLLDVKNRGVISHLQVGRERPRLLVLRDKSVLVLGGIAAYVGEKKTFTNAVERISLVTGLSSLLTGALKIERLPDLPGEVRRGVSFVELSDGRVMALGGSTSPYVGNEPMTADTYILDPEAKTWRTGPKMVESRTNATATLLPDGSVLVAGGWTPKHTWQDVPTRSTERWDPRSDRFSTGAQLVIGVADHQAMWAPGQQGKRLLVAGGMVMAWQGGDTVQEYDLAGDLWRSTGESCPADTNVVVKSGEVVAVPYSFGGRSYLWCTRAAGRSAKWSLVSLRIPSSGGDGPQRVDAVAGIALHRRGLAFLPPQGDSPGLAVGGLVNGAPSAAVDAIWPDGRTQPVAALNHTRAGAQVFRLQDGSFLVAGGVSGDRTRRTQYFPPAELLSAGPALDKARWLVLDPQPEEGSVLGQLRDGSLIAVKPDGSVEHLIVTGASEGKPAAQSSSFPSLNRNRRTPEGEREAAFLVVKQVRDGRIVVAGGEEQRHRIAVLHEHAMEPDAPDQFVGIGDYIPSRTHEIYDPAAKVWRESAPSRGAGSRVAILEDGRVVKWGGMAVEAAPGNEESVDRERRERGILEISTADGKSWREFDAREAPTITTNVMPRAVRPFAVQDELFLLGVNLTDMTPNYARGSNMVQWFNTANRRWETLWEGTEKEWRDGRLILRHLPNGKDVMLFVEGS